MQMRGIQISVTQKEIRWTCHKHNIHVFLTINEKSNITHILQRQPDQNLLTCMKVWGWNNCSQQWGSLYVILSNVNVKNMR